MMNDVSFTFIKVSLQISAQNISRPLRRSRAVEKDRTMLCIVKAEPGAQHSEVQYTKVLQ